MDNIEAIVLVYRQILQGFQELQKYAIDGQIEATDTGRADMAEIEDLGLMGEKLLEKYKHIIIEFESLVDPPKLNPHFQRMFDNNPLTNGFRREIV